MKYYLCVDLYNGHLPAMVVRGASARGAAAAYKALVCDMPDNQTYMIRTERIKPSGALARKQKFWEVRRNWDISRAMPF